MLESLAFNSNHSHGDAKKLTELHEACILHGQILEESKRAIQLAPLYGMLTSLVFKMRSILFVLYALEFTSDQSLISLIVDMDWFIDGIFALIILYITDIWRYDYMILLGAFVDLITCFIEASSWSFTVLAIVYTFSDQPTESMFCAYITHILPVNMSKQYVSYFYQSARFSYGLAPVISGVIVYYSDYRMAYWAATGLAFIGLILCLYMFVQLDQSSLEQRQLSLTRIYQEYEINTERAENINTKKQYGDTDTDMRWLVSKDFRFPVVLSHHQSIAINGDNVHADDGNASENNGDDVNININDGNDHDVESRFSIYQWFCIYLVSIQFGLVNGNVILISIYYTVFMKDKYDCNIIISTAQVSTAFIFFAVGMKIIQLIDKKHSDETNHHNVNGTGSNIRKYDLNNYIIIVSTVVYFICIVITTAIIYCSGQLGIDENYNYSYFIIVIIYGTLLGMLYMMQNILIILIQPRLRSGTTVAVRSTIQYLVTALSLTAVGILYVHVSREWLFYWQGVNCCMSLLCLSVIVLAETT